MRRTTSVSRHESDSDRREPDRLEVSARAHDTTRRAGRRTSPNTYLDRRSDPFVRWRLKPEFWERAFLTRRRSRGPRARDLHEGPLRGLLDVNTGDAIRTLSGRNLTQIANGAGGSGAALSCDRLLADLRRRTRCRSRLRWQDRDRHFGGFACQRLKEGYG